MKRNTSTNNKKGFSLIELCIALGVLAILTSSITPVFIKRIQVKAGEKTALEMSGIQQAALSYYAANNAWPASLVVLQSAGYLNPSWVTNNPWQNAYTISSNTNVFTVLTTVPQEWTKLVARDLPASSISGTIVGSSVSAPGSIQNDSLPIGSIVIWSGTVTSIPIGWQLCDGTNGTPDLRDKFMVGARQDSGGTAMTNVSGSLTKTGGEAKHTLTIAEMPAHTHSYWSAGTGGNQADGGSFRWIGHYNDTTGSTGGNQSHNILPPYYAVCFIMKMQ